MQLSRHPMCTKTHLFENQFNLISNDLTATWTTPETPVMGQPSPALLRAGNGKKVEEQQKKQKTQRE